VHAGGSAQNGGGKRNVLIVSLLLPIAIDLALRSNMQRRIDVLRVCQSPVLLWVATAPITFMCNAEVEDQDLAASLVSQVVVELHVAAPLASACRDSLLGADRVSSRAEESAKGKIPSSCVSCCTRINFKNPGTSSSPCLVCVHRVFCSST